MPALPQFLQQIHAIARLEAGYVMGQAKIAWSVLAVALIPALYSVIYLSSLWDPASHSQALNVGIVNSDQGLPTAAKNSTKVPTTCAQGSKP